LSLSAPLVLRMDGVVSDRLFMTSAPLIDQERSSLPFSRWLEHTRVGGGRLLPRLQLEKE